MKTCFKCNLEKPLSEFYKHSQMGDGYLGKCKECTKKDVNSRYKDPAARQKIREYEKRRFQSPERKAKIIIYQRERRKKNKDKYVARTLIANKIKNGSLIRMPCEICGDPKSQAHHHDYSEPLNVRWLCFKHHREAHGQLVG